MDIFLEKDLEWFWVAGRMPTSYYKQSIIIRNLWLILENYFLSHIWRNIPHLFVCKMKKKSNRGILNNIFVDWSYLFLSIELRLKKAILWTKQTNKPQAKRTATTKQHQTELPQSSKHKRILHLCALNLQILCGFKTVYTL